MNSLAINIIAGLSLALILLLGWNHYQDVRETRDRYKTERNQARADLEKCKTAKITSEEIGNDHQKQIRNLNAQLVNARRLRLNARCEPISGLAGETIGDNGRAARGKLSRGNGLSVEYLIDFAGRCEETRLKTIAAQSFIDSIYELNQ